MRIFFLFSFENFLCVYINILFIYGKNIIYNIEIKNWLNVFMLICEGVILFLEFVILFYII